MFKKKYTTLKLFELQELCMIGPFFLKISHLENNNISGFRNSQGIYERLSILSTQSSFSNFPTFETVN